MNKLERINQLKNEIDNYRNKLNEINYSRDGYAEDNEYPHEEYINEEDYIFEEVAKLEFELREIEYKEEEEHRRTKNAKQFHNDGFFISDSESRKDLLSRTVHAEEISKLISNNKTLSPLTLAIYGPWGEGKSSFLRLIEKELENINHKFKKDKNFGSQFNKTHLIRFDASEYNDQDKIWYSMLNQLFAKYEDEVGLMAKIKYGFGMFKNSIKNNKWIYIMNIVLIIIFSTWVLIYIKDKSILEVLNDNALITNILGLISTITVATNIVMPILKRIKFLSNPITNKFFSQLIYPDYKNLLGTRENVKENLYVLIDAWTKKSGDKIVVFVDELDRCSEKTIVEFFDALQIFLPVESIVHVLSINQEAVCYALANNNLHFFDKEIISNKEKLDFGMKYLEKYITIPYHLPYDSNYSSYIDHLLSGNSVNEQDSIFSSSEKITISKILIEVDEGNHITPREVKKLINLLLLSKERLINYNKNKEKGVLLEFEEYSRWVLFNYFFPEIANYIMDYIEKFYKFNQYKTFKEIVPHLLTKDFKEINNYNQSKELFKYISDIRVEYIIISNNISEVFIIK